MKTQSASFSSLRTPSFLLSLLALGAFSVQAQALMALPGPAPGIPIGNVSIRCPGDLTVECATDVPFPAETLKQFQEQGGSVSYDCPGRAALAHVSDVAEGSCPVVITRTYEVNTPCGKAQCKQTITVDDTEAPTFVGLSDGTVECGVATKIVVVGDDNCNRLEFDGVLAGGTALAGATLVQLSTDSFQLTMTNSGYVLINFTVSDGCHKVVQTVRYLSNCD